MIRYTLPCAFALGILATPYKASAETYICTKQNTTLGSDYIYSAQFSFDRTSKIMEGNFKRKYDLGGDTTGSATWAVQAKISGEDDSFNVSGRKTLEEAWQGNGVQPKLGVVSDFSGKFIQSSQTPSIFLWDFSSDLTFVEMRCY